MRRAWAVAATVMGLSVVPDVVGRHGAHAGPVWHSLPAFDLVFGFFGCAFIVLASKALGRAGLQKPESFYGDDE